MGSASDEGDYGDGNWAVTEVIAGTVVKALLVAEAVA